MVQRFPVSLSKCQVIIDREEWIKLAEESEASGAPITCGSVIRHTIGIGIDREDRKRTWVADAEVRS